jgi:hypothetical protein
MKTGSARREFYQNKANLDHYAEAFPTAVFLRTAVGNLSSNRFKLVQSKIKNQLYK